MKYKIPSFILLSLLVLLAYQNCSNNLKLNTSEGVTESVSSLNIELSEMKQIRYWSYSDKRNPTEWILNLQKAELIEKSSASGEVQSTYCIAYEDLSNLLDFLNANSLCQKQVSDPEVVCSQIYTSPYAFLDFSEKSIPLGEEKDGCAKERIDFCNQKSEAFLIEVEKLLSKRFSVRCL